MFQQQGEGALNFDLEEKRGMVSRKVKVREVIKVY